MKKGWSFCIVTDGNNDDNLIVCIEKIRKEFQGEKYFEIVIIGNSRLFKIYKDNNIRFYPFKEVKSRINESKKSDFIRKFKIFFNPKKYKPIYEKVDKFIKDELNYEKYMTARYSDLPGAQISKKKNVAARKAKFNKLCILHDYVGLEDGWKKGFEKFGDNWDIATNIILNQDDSRHRDWTAWDYPGVGQGLIPYDKYTKYMYISGTYFCVKRDFFLKNLLNEDLFWAEGEDVEWSLRVRELTKFQMNINSTVKYLKLKPLDQAPYSGKWFKNKPVLEELLSQEGNNNE